MKPGPVRLLTSFKEKTWGVDRLSPWFTDQPGKIGEVWFSMPQGDSLPLMVKFIFTSERLSVQVHPDDQYALEHEGRGGKMEMWYVLAAGPGAKLAAGFREPVTREQAREAAVNGKIEGLLHWWPVQAGQVYLVPPGTVHTLGPGLTVCEIQQDNQITYRLYDYGRGRELHLSKALDVARLDTYPGPEIPAGDSLASCPRFVTDRLEVSELRYAPEPGRFHLLVVLEGGGSIAGQSMAPGQVWHIPAGAEPFMIQALHRAVLLRTCLPA